MILTWAMTSHNILIATMKLDPHADAVIDQLQEMGETVFRLNTEDLLNEYSLSLGHYDNVGISGILSDNLNRSIIIPDQIRSAYYRKPKAVNPHSSLETDGSKQFAISEGEEVLRTLYSLPGIKWINSPFAIRSAQSKLPQLAIAKHYHLKVPKTLITNNPDHARQFCQEHNYDVICKSLITTSVKLDDISFHTYTYRLSEHEVQEFIDNVEYTPTLFQEYVRKKTEIRATVIGDEVFACEIDSQSITESMVDWRQIDPFKVPHKPFDLPFSVAESLRNLILHFGLVFGAIDLILTPDGDYVFLENNPNGQWYWIELLTGMPMARSMAKLLVSN